MDDTLTTPPSTRAQARLLQPASANRAAAEPPQTKQATAGTPPLMNKVARGLGWFSIALGLAELLAPATAAQATGSRARKKLLQAYGVREIANGIGLLTARDPAPWLWARVGGDALDIATLASDLGNSNERRRNTAWSLLAVMGVTALDVWAAQAATGAASAAPARDYSDRVGMALSPDEMRGTARDAMALAPDLQTPSALRPYALH